MKIVVKPKQEFCDNCNNDVCCCIIKKPKKTAVEFLKMMYEKNNNLNTLDFLIAKGMEKEQQGYSEEDMRECYHFAQIEQQKEFSSIYVGMSFEKWYDKIYKNEQKINL